MSLQFAKELRIGNYLMEAGGKIFAIDIGDLKYIREGMKKYQYIPVSLSEEILLACGFENKPNGIYKNDLFNLCLFDNNEWFWCNQQGVEVFSPMPLIKYLHQLQNIYHSLTGKEIVYSPNTV